jgi:hypothetical protein
MLAHATNPRRTVVLAELWLPHADEHWAEYVELVRRMGSVPHKEGERVTIVCAPDADYPTPDARWRRAIADVSAVVRPEHRFILVAPNTIVQGILTAVNWIRPIPCEYFAVSSLEQAADRLDWQDADDLERLHALCQRERNQDLGA